MKAILLLIGLFIAVPLLSQENKDSIKAAIAFEIELLTAQKDQMKLMLELLDAGKQATDSVIRDVKSKNVQIVRYVDSMDVEIVKLKKSRDKSKETKKILKEWKQTRAETLNGITDNIDKVDGIEKHRRQSLDDYKQTEEIINKLEKQIEELKKLN
jgi:hypothetical protein